MHGGIYAAIVLLLVFIPYIWSFMSLTFEQQQDNNVSRINIDSTLTHKHTHTPDMTIKKCGCCGSTWATMQDVVYAMDS